MNWDEQRHRMVDIQILARGITDTRLTSAMREIPRHDFIPDPFRQRAYEDCALPIGCGQTISQPYMVALMLRVLALTGLERVLEIGAGSGYQAALLSRLSKEVHTLEILPELAARATTLLKQYKNVTVHCRDGSGGLPEAAPFDAIVAAAATPEIPDAWVVQLRGGGKLLVPVGKGPREVLTLVEVRGREICRTLFGECAFVPLTGEAGTLTD